MEPPHLNAVPACFIEADGPVYTLVGGVLDRTGVPEDAPILVQIAEGVGREYDAEFLPMFEFFKTPREEWQVRDWMEWAGGDDVLSVLLETKAVIRVDTHDPLTAAASLAGLRVIPQCVPDPDPVRPRNPGLIDVLRDPSDTSVLMISAELAEALFGRRTRVDVPAVIDFIVGELGAPRVTTARRVVSEIPMLLHHGYARLEWLDAPTGED